MAIVPISELKVIFKGVSSFRFSPTVQATVAAADWKYELPIVSDSFDITQASGTTTPTNVLGLAGAWTISGEPGDISINFTIPSIKDSLLGEFYEKTAAELRTANEVVGAVTGSFKGYGYKLKRDMIEGSALIISENGDYALFIKNIQGYPSLVLSDGIGAPMGVTMNAMVVGGNTECDFALLKWTPAT